MTSQLSRELTTHTALTRRVDEIAVEIGRLRRHPACQPDTSLAHLADRLAGHAETLDCILQPTAADLYQAHLDDGRDDHSALQLALHQTDRRARTFRAALGTETRA